MSHKLHTRMQASRKAWRTRKAMKAARSVIDISQKTTPETETHREQSETLHVYRRKLPNPFLKIVRD
jgi:hypothetical protein